MILIGLGSNLTTDDFASSSEILEAAIAAMMDHDIVVLDRSRFYETEPVPKSDQPWYVNAVIRVETKLGATELLKKLHEIEHDLGRTRRKRWEARIIDLDLLCFRDEIHPSAEKWADVAAELSPDGAVIPHGRLHKRDFVLIPLADFAKDWIHPMLGKSVEKMLNEQQSVGIVRLL
jgi:2-amino-4-hydroxy-6-hydroxymethyldihydropteridine diphosphokinase|tara:strand:+ start:99732 stop:100259 length:528 start_codon:yes stop_codon:yes gene_type:complete